MVSKPLALVQIATDRADLDVEDVSGQEGKQMDDRRFDALTRSLATGLSRRKAFKGLFGLAVLGGTAASGVDRVTAQTCPEGEFLCNGACCPNANNCCGETTCCPSSQCNQNAGICCQSFEFACGTGDCCNTAQEKCCNGVCISAALCCPSLPDCGECETCVQGVCQPIVCDPCATCVQGVCQPIVCDPCETCAGGECVSACEGEEHCCTATGAAPYCAQCCGPQDCPTCWECDAQGVCQETAFLCGSTCCPVANNCCGGTTCCPPSQCNQASGTCCLETEFFCGTGDNACCDIATEKCCDGICISASLCCPSLPDCPVGQTCCAGVCEDLQNDPTNCGACAADCSAGLVCCYGVCRECCDDEDCESCDRCIDGTCEALLCEDPCEFCDVGVDECVRVCPEDQFCCVVSPPPDLVVECVDGDECCETDECGECATCINGLCEPDSVICPIRLVGCCVDDELVCVECCHDEDCEGCSHCVDGTCEPDTVLCSDGVACCIDDELICAECCVDADCDSCATCEAGVCVPLALPCPLGQVNCCVNNELICTECCRDADCGDCERCHEGTCRSCESGGLECCDGICSEEECCVHFGDECGLREVTPAGGDWPLQLDCCYGLVCCEAKHGAVCAECCTDHECPKGWICCLGQCREMECCIDDILIGLDPNRRCPEGCNCFEGICDCHCQSNKDCAHGACCCKDGTCSEHCCHKGCDHNKDCGYGTCCCHDGSCSAKCCGTPYTPPVYTLPGTGSGSTAGGDSNIAAVAFGAAAAYMAAKKLRQQQAGEEPAEE